MQQATSSSSSRLLVAEASARPATCCPCLHCVICMLVGSSVLSLCHLCVCRVICVVIVPSVCLSCHHCLHCAVQKWRWGASMFWEDVIESGRHGVRLDNWRVGGRACVGVGMDVPCGRGYTVWVWMYHVGKGKK